MIKTHLLISELSKLWIFVLTINELYPPIDADISGYITGPELKEIVPDQVNARMRRTVELVNKERERLPSFSQFTQSI